MHERDVMPTPREMADEEMLQKARERGIRLGFEGMFLDCFIEREIAMMWKWRTRAGWRPAELQDE